MGTVKMAIYAVLLREFVVVWFFQSQSTLPTPGYVLSFLTVSHKGTHFLCVKYYIWISKWVGFGMQDLTASVCAEFFRKFLF